MNQLQFHPSGLTRSQFELLYRYANDAEVVPILQLMELANRHLAETREAHQNNRLVNLRLASAIREVLASVVAQWEQIDANASFWLAGAILYYASSDDDEVDLTSPIGFDDDVEVLNACLRLAHLDSLCLNSEEYDDL